MMNLKKKLVLDYENEVLIDMAQQLAYNNDKLEENMGGEVLQEDMNNLAIHMTNSYIQQDDKNYSQSPLQTQRDYFNEHIDEISKLYANGQLPEIKYGDDTLEPHQYGIISIFKESIGKLDNLNELLEKEPDFEMDLLKSIKEDYENQSCDIWCKSCDIVKQKMNEYNIQTNQS